MSIVTARERKEKKKTEANNEFHSTGVDGVDLVIGTSSFLREFSHGKSMAYIQKTAIEVIEYLKGYVAVANACALGASEANMCFLLQ